MVEPPLLPLATCLSNHIYNVHGRHLADRELVSLCVKLRELLGIYYYLERMLLTSSITLGRTYEIFNPFNIVR